MVIKIATVKCDRLRCDKFINIRVIGSPDFCRVNSVTL